MIRDVSGASRSVQMQHRKKDRSLWGEIAKWTLIAGTVAAAYIAVQPSQILREHLPKQTQEEQGNVVDSFIRQYQDVILAAAKEHDLPPELLEARLETENMGDIYFHDLRDKVKTAVGGNASVGVMQVRADTARAIDRKKGEVKGTIADYVQLLQDPVQNIRYAAEIYADIRDSSPLTQGLSAEQLLLEPRLLGYVDSKYQAGRKAAIFRQQPDQPVVICEAHLTLANIVLGLPLEVTSTEQFRREAKRNIAEYLEREGIGLVERVCEQDFLTVDSSYLREAVRTAKSL